ncbi:helix-turn-helix transcriptional regulator [Endozoicomonas atrinae]|uniref:helix-turn-helix transcriptional regulator n=1 Tax=Endozoicomonas atrinae TaxID=1333660 RepID=UPI0008263CC8|nr:AlpA family phage regulatory protein [Endozoicomonas atrinae]
MDAPELVNISTVVKMTTLSKATIYRMIKEGEFPKGVMISKKRRVWKKQDVVDTINNLLQADQ